jgi:hypothetical protein
MTLVIGKFTVDDYETWKNGTFDRDPAGRDGAAMGHHVYRDTESPNDVIVAVEFDSTEAARAFRDRLHLSGALDGVRLGGLRVCDEAESITY